MVDKMNVLKVGVIVCEEDGSKSLYQSSDDKALTNLAQSFVQAGYMMVVVPRLLAPMSFCVAHTHSSIEDADKMFHTIVG